MNWILLILIQSPHYNPATLPQNMGFKTQTACENAAEEIKKLVGSGVTIRTTCIKR